MLLLNSLWVAVKSHYFLMFKSFVRPITLILKGCMETLIAEYTVIENIELVYCVSKEMNSSVAPGHIGNYKMKQ